MKVKWKVSNVVFLCLTEFSTRVQLTIWVFCDLRFTDTCKIQNVQFQTLTIIALAQSFTSAYMTPGIGLYSIFSL